MCQKYILDACKETLPSHCKVEDKGDKLVIHYRHDKYRGDATWSINTVTDADGDKRTEVVVEDCHNIEKAILYIQHTDPYNYIPGLMRRVREVMDNPIIPESLIRSRFKGMIKHGFLTVDGKVTSKGYEALMMLRNQYARYRRNLPTKLRETIDALGSDLVRECST